MQRKDKKKEGLSPFPCGLDVCVFLVQLDDFVCGNFCLVLAVCGLAILITAFLLGKITKPVEYRR